MGNINLEIKIKNLEAKTAGEINDTINNIYGTSDHWSSKSSWQVGEICIYDNKLWKCLISNSHTPSDGTEWEQISLKTLLNLTDNPWILSGASSGASNTIILDFSSLSLPSGIYEIKIGNNETTNGYFTARWTGTNIVVNIASLETPASGSGTELTVNGTGYFRNLYYRKLK